MDFKEVLMMSCGVLGLEKIGRLPSFLFISWHRAGQASVASYPISHVTLSKSLLVSLHVSAMNGGGWT